MSSATDHVVLLHYRVPLGEIEVLLPAHRTWLESGYADGIFRDSGPRDPRTGGVILARGIDRAALERRLARDPFALAGAADAEIVSYTGRVTPELRAAA